MSAASIRCGLANRLWLASAGPASRRFRRSLECPDDVQRAHLLRLLRRNAASAFGAEHGFSAISSVADFQRRVPLSSYEDYRARIDAIAAGQPHVLTAEPVRLFEPTSGSSAAIKYIPCTRALQQEFQAGIAPWIGSLFGRRPSLMDGPAYWSISPRTDAPDRLGTIPVGFDDDASYLGGFARRLFHAVSAVPASVARIRDVPAFQERTLLHLLNAPDLRLISVWSPAFLTVLLRRFLDSRLDMLDALAASGLPAAAERSRAIRAGADGDPASVFARIWPRLQLVSCWTHGASAVSLAGLTRLLPSVAIQGKGLIATEAFVSLPFEPTTDPVLAVASHFFEFRDADTGRIALAHELDVGRAYSVVVTTGGGLYRYDLRDVVEVTGHIGRAPALRFVGRDSTSDRFGEKLAAAYVDPGVRDILSAHGLQPGFVLLAPDTRPDGSVGYTLFIDGASAPDALLGRLGSDVERMLRRAVHYDYCRRLGQLAAVRVYRLRVDAAAAERAYLDHGAGRGMRLGNVKPAILVQSDGWRERLAGAYVPEGALQFRRSCHECVDGDWERALL